MITIHQIWLVMNKDENKWYKVKDFNPKTQKQIGRVADKLSKLYKQRYIFRKQVRKDGKLIYLYKVK